MKINYPQRVNFPICLDVNLFEIYNENKLPPKSKVYSNYEHTSNAWDYFKFKYTGEL